MNGTKTLLIALAWLMAAAPCLAQASGNYNRARNRASGNYNPAAGNTVSGYDDGSDLAAQVGRAAYPSNVGEVVISVKALANVKAVSNIVIFSIIEDGKTATETDEAFNGRLADFKGKLSAFGISEESVLVDMISFLPVYEYEIDEKLFSRSAVERPKGYQLKKNVHIVYERAELLDRIVTAAAESGIYEIVKVDYFAENPEAVYADLRRKAIALLKQKEKDYSALGVALDSAQRVFGERQDVSYPGERYEYYRFSSGPPPRSVKDDKVVTAERPTIGFYHSLNAKGFDIVVNPEILEPAIQYVYGLSVRYLLPRERKTPEPEKRLFLLRPDGTVAPVKID